MPTSADFLYLVLHVVWDLYVFDTLEAAAATTAGSKMRARTLVRDLASSMLQRLIIPIIFCTEHTLGGSGVISA